MLDGEFTAQVGQMQHAHGIPEGYHSTRLPMSMLYIQGGNGKKSNDKSHALHVRCDKSAVLI